MIKNIVFMCLAHVLGDFYFQTEKMANNKVKFYRWVLAHSLEYTVVVMLMSVLLLDMNPDVLLASILVAFCHFVIDTGKFLLVRKRKLKNGDVVSIDFCV